MIVRKLSLLTALSLGFVGFYVTSTPAHANSEKQRIMAAQSHLLENVSNAGLQNNIHRVIEDQLRAIRDRDDRVAYDLSTAADEEEFNDPQSYMRHLRRDKKPLYEHVSFEILPSNAQSKFHKVSLIDKRGKQSIAMFKVKKDQYGAWRVDNVVILQSSEDPI